jgi:hypothetical protein
MADASTGAGGRVPRLLYILSLERSGSTPLCYNLGLRPGFVALGEVDRTLALMMRPGGLPRPACSCGAAAGDCPVWGPLVAATEELRPLDLAGRYRRLDAILGALLPADTVLVDASKSPETLAAIRPVFGARLAVAHLVKDVRGYLDSVLGRAATMSRSRLWGEAIGRRPLRGRAMRAMPQSLLYLLRWTRRNRAMAADLAGRPDAWMRVGYDELTRAPEAWLERMAHLAGAGRGASGHHILLGSFGYLDGPGDKALRPDQRWRDSPRRRLLDLAGLAAGRLNRRLAKGEVHAGHGARSITT